MPCGERAAITVADVLRDRVAGLRTTREQAKAVSHILACRTGRLGGHVAVCNRCGYTHFAYHSCHDRHCPTCGSLDQALWAEAQLQHLLPVSYFHLVFTVPASLRPFFARNGRALALEALFAAVSETILETAARRGLRPGVLAVLHTWTQKLTFHPHLHCLVTGGGLGPDGFVHRRRYLLPRRVLQIVFKAKLLDKLEALLRDRKADVGCHSGHELLRDARRRDWNIDIRRPLAGAEHVVRYFARYTAGSPSPIAGSSATTATTSPSAGAIAPTPTGKSSSRSRARSSLSDSSNTSCPRASSASADTDCSAIASANRSSRAVENCSTPIDP